MKTLFFSLLLISGLSSIAQTTKKKPVYDPKKHGSCTVAKVEKDEKCPGDMAHVMITFVGAAGTPCKRGVRVTRNHDSLVPTLDATGSYSVEVEPGKYNFHFSAPYWYRVHAAPLVLKEQTTTYLNVKFEAVEMIGGH
jgi:hypothetical protein